MKHFFEGFPPTAHPMAILSAMVAALSSYYPDSLDADNVELRDMMIARLVSKVRTIAAFAYKKSIGQPFVYPKNSLSYCANFLNMMFSVPAEEYEIDPELVKVMNLLLILHADHEQNCSTSAPCASSDRARPTSSRPSARASAPSGGRSTAAPTRKCSRCSTAIHEGRRRREEVRRSSPRTRTAASSLMGFGHRVYKNFDPRAKIIKAAADKVLAKLGKKDPLLDIAKALEEAALKDSYFVERKLYPNVDFYSGIIYRAMGFPTNMFTVLFALGRLPGWIAHWKEMIEDNDDQDRPSASDLHRPHRSSTTSRWTSAGRRPTGGFHIRPEPRSRIQSPASIHSMIARQRNGPNGRRDAMIPVPGAVPRGSSSRASFASASPSAAAR